MECNYTLGAESEVPESQNASRSIGGGGGVKSAFGWMEFQ